MGRVTVFGILGLLPLLALAGTTPPVATQVSLVKRDTGTFYMAGELRGYGELQLLLDTGSSYMVIGRSVLSALQDSGDAHFSRDIRGVMADGRPRVVPLYRLSALRLGHSCWIHDVEAAVLDEGTRAILGMDVLARLAPFTFSAEPPQLGLSGCRSQASGVVAEATRPGGTPSP